MVISPYKMHVHHVPVVHTHMDVYLYPPQVILASEATREEAINHATGEAEALYRTAEATARALGVSAFSRAERKGCT